MSETGNHTHYTYRSLFWPIILIGVGLVWLLGNLHIIAPVGFFAVAQLWPLLLIAIGLDLIFGHSHPLVGALIGLCVVALTAGLLIGAPMLGLGLNTATAPQLKTGHYSTPVDKATSAQVNLGFSAGNLTVHSLSDSNALFDANLNYVGDVNFTTEGDTSKTVSLRQGGGMQGWPFGTGEQVRWDVGLSPKVPTNLSVQSSSGNVTLNLADLKLRGLAVELSSGDVKATLPPSEEAYDVDVHVSSGNLTFVLPDKADVNNKVNISSGNLTFDVPAKAGVQVNVRNLSSGNVNVPPAFKRTAETGRKTGTWESANYSGADYKIVITIENISSGNINIRSK
jgi:hypothetical protein